jgi:hypothetical protein
MARAQGMGGGGVPDTDPGLVGWWKLDGEMGGATADSSGRGYHGLVHGNPQWVPGRVGGGLLVNGVDDYVDTDCQEALAYWTVSTWVQSAAAPTGALASGPVHRQANYQLNWNHETPAFRGAAGVRIAKTWYPASFGALEASTWYHLAATFDGAALRAYVNGELVTTNAKAVGVPDTEPTTLKIGRHSALPQFFGGTIDEVRIYNRALTQQEIQRALEGVPLTASNPYPADRATVDARDARTLIWSAGRTAVWHDVYLGLDQDAVAAATATSPLYWGRQRGTNFSLAGRLEVGRPHFWRIDEVEADGKTIHKGAVWTFTVPQALLIVDQFEPYTEGEGNRLCDTWVDGSVNQTGAQVDYPAAPVAERTIVHSGRQSMPLSYNNAEPPFYSETWKEFLPAQNWRTGLVDTLSLWFRGDVVSFAETAPDVFTMSAAGADIWGNADQFRFAYKRLTGDGSIIARVESLGNSDPWAKAGVMIRASFDPGSTHAFMLVTPDGRRSFQNRSFDKSGCQSAHGGPGAISLPCWVKVQRQGNLFTGYYSTDGINWIQQPDNENTGTNRSPNPQTIEMASTVHVGLALTSHTADKITTATFSSVATTGTVRGPWQTADVGVPQPGNTPDDLYVVVEDSAGKAAVVTHPDPWAVNALEWTEWRIPLASLTGVNLGSVKKMSLGVGSRKTPVPDGTGRIYIDDIYVVK